MLDFMYQVLPAIERALITDLPDIRMARRGNHGTTSLRRPIRAELNIFVFPQVWNTPALGFATGRELSNPEEFAVTAAYTAVVIHECGVAAVYFGGSFAYLAPLSSDLEDDIRNHSMRPVAKKSFYGRITPEGEEIQDAVQGGHDESQP